VSSVSKWILQIRDVLKSSERSVRRGELGRKEGKTKLEPTAGNPSVLSLQTSQIAKVLLATGCTNDETSK
jgi:hypothetical protein